MTTGRKWVHILALGLVLGAGAYVARGAADRSLPITWATVSTRTEMWVVLEGTGKPWMWEPKVLGATTGLTLGHVVTDEDQELKHGHYEKEFGDVGAKTKDEAKNYWNERFDVNGGKCTRYGDAWNKQNCYSWAFGGLSGGTYTYAVLNATEAEKAYDDETVQVTPETNAEAGDLIKCSGGHVSIVDMWDSLDCKPSTIKFKVGQSAVYTYDTKQGTEWNLPHNVGVADPDKLIGDQGWTWTESYRTKVSVHRSD